MTFAYGALTLYGARFHNASARHRLCNSSGHAAAVPGGSHNPVAASPAGCATATVWALPVSLAATQGVAVAFLSSGY